MYKYIIFLSLFAIAAKFSNAGSKTEDTTNVPGAAIMLIEDGSPINTYCTGYANLKTKELINSNTNFRLASLSKQFTAAAVLILVQEGRLKLENTLTDIFTDFPEYGKKVTIRHLLTHTSGIIDYESLIPAKTKKQLSDKDVLGMLSKIDSVYFLPGEQFRYSNSGYALLAMIVEKISGLKYSTFLKNKIFIPLEMNSTIAYEKGKSTIKNRALGYSYNGSKYEENDQSITSAVLGDGGIYSNLEDLCKWDQALYSESLLKKPLLDSAFSKASLNSGEKINYGFGWEIADADGMKILQHTGSTAGFANKIVRIPGKNTSLIILTNKDDTDVDTIASEVIKQLINPSSEDDNEIF